MSLRKITIFSAVALFGTIGVASAQKPKVAVLGLEVVDSGGMDAKTVKLASSLTVALRKRASLGAGPYKLASKGNKDLLEVKLLGNCDSEAPPCMSAIGRDLGASVVIYGKLQKRAKKGYQVTLFLLDAKKKKMIRNKSEMIGLDDTSPTRVNEWARRLYNALTGVPEQGKILVKSNVQTGQVYINGEIKGGLTGGTREITGVAEGTMEVRVESDGYAPFSTEVTVKGGKTVEVTANLADEKSIGGGKPEKPGGTARILFFSTAAVAATGVVVASVSGLRMQGFEEDKDTARFAYQNATGVQLNAGNVCGDMAVTDATDGLLFDIKTACDSGKSSATLANIMWGVAGVSAAAAGYFFYKGFLQPKSANTESARKRGKKPATTVVVTPTVLPTYVGAGVKIEF